MAIPQSHPHILALFDCFSDTFGFWCDGGRLVVWRTAAGSAEAETATERGYFFRLINATAYDDNGKKRDVANQGKNPGYKEALNKTSVGVSD